MRFILLLLLFGCSGGKEKAPPLPPAIDVSAFRVEAQDIPADFQFVGVARSSHPVEIRARVEGYIWSIDYTEGSMVEENDLLFQLDPRPFEASLAIAEGELARQEAILWRAERDLERMKPLFAENAASQRDLDDATAQVLAAEAEVFAAKANVMQAKLNLSFTHITSPIKGLSARAVFREGTLITPSVNGLMTLVSVIDPIWVLFSISDNDFLAAEGEKSASELILPAQQEYTVKLQLSDGTYFPYPGKVNFTSPTLDPDTSSLVVRAEFPNPEGNLLPGQFVRAIVCGATRPHAIFVPQKAVCQGQHGAYVFVIDKSGKAHQRPVQLGDWYQDYWIIKQGLKEGDVVIADGVNKVQDGTFVRIVDFSSAHPGQKK